MVRNGYDDRGVNMRRRRRRRSKTESFLFFVPPLSCVHNYVTRVLLAFDLPPGERKKCIFWSREDAAIQRGITNIDFK